MNSEQERTEVEKYEGPVKLQENAKPTNAKIKAAAVNGDAGEVANAYFKVLQKKAQDAFGSNFGLTYLRAVEHESKFQYYWYKVTDSTYNESAYKFISSCYQGNNDGNPITRLGDYSFSTAMKEVYTALDYNFSEEDKKKLEDSKIRSKDALSNLISAYIENIGKVTGDNKGDAVITAILAWASSDKKVTLPDLVGVGDFYSVLTAAPAMASQVFPYLSDYLAALADGVNLTYQQLYGVGTKKTVLANLTTPTQKNGGLPLDDGYYAKYTMTPNGPEVEQRLNAEGNKIDINVEVTKTDTNGFSASVDGSVSIPFFGEWITGALNGGGSYSYSKDIAVGSKMSIQITLPGVTVVSVKPEALDFPNSKFWYSTLPIIKARSGNKDATGWVFNDTPQYDLDVSGNFGFAKNILISREPTIKISYVGSQSEDIKKNWSAQENLGFTLFGILSFDASSKQSGYETSFFEVSGGFGVEYKPPTISAPPDDFDRTAYLIGVDVAWPAAIQTGNFVSSLTGNLENSLQKSAAISNKWESASLPSTENSITVFGGNNMSGRQFAVVPGFEGGALLRLWEFYNGIAKPKCSAIGCDGEPNTGGPVEFSYRKNCQFIIPLCMNHGKRSNTMETRTKASTRAVMIKPQPIAPKKE